MLNPGALRKAMREAKITGRELAIRVKCSDVTISRIKNARQTPTRALAESIARALGVELEVLCGDETSKAKAVEPAGGYDLTEDELQVVRALRQLPPATRERAIGFILGWASGAQTPGAADQGPRPYPQAAVPGTPPTAQPPISAAQTRRHANQAHKNWAHKGH